MKATILFILLAKYLLNTSGLYIAPNKNSIAIAKPADCYYESYTVKGFDIDKINKILANRDYSTPLTISNKNTHGCIFDITKTPYADEYTIKSYVGKKKGVCPNSGGYIVSQNFCITPDPDSWCTVAAICCEENEPDSLVGSCSQKHKITKIAHNKASQQLYKKCKATNSDCYKLEAYTKETPLVGSSPSMIKNLFAYLSLPYLLLFVK